MKSIDFICNIDQKIMLNDYIQYIYVNVTERLFYQKNKDFENFLQNIICLIFFLVKFTNFYYIVK